MGPFSMDTPTVAGSEARLSVPSTPAGVALSPLIRTRPRLSATDGSEGSFSHQIGDNVGRAGASTVLDNHRDGTFECVKCHTRWPLQNAVPKRSQLWCDRDNASYNALQLRWGKNTKLKTWQQALGPIGQTPWFLK